MSQITVIGWREKLPPRQTWVMASWSVMGTMRPVLTCKHGCCVSDGIACMTLPKYWRDLNDDEFATLNAQLARDEEHNA